MLDFQNRNNILLSPYFKIPYFCALLKGWQNKFKKCFIRSPIFLIINQIMCLLQLFVSSSRFEIVFSTALAGASSSRSATTRKKLISKLQSFSLLPGALKVDLLLWLFVYTSP
jgi:hypothetical protein